LTATGKNCCHNGGRIPAVWFYSTSPTATKNKLLICSAVNGNGNFCFTSGVNILRGQWTTIEINQHREGNSYRYIVKVNGAVLGSVINKKAQEFSNVKVFGADNWHNAAQGSMRNLIINPDLKVVLSGSTLMMPAVRVNKRKNLLAIIPKLTKSYSVKFEFNPTRFQGGWTNIIHLTATGNNCCHNGGRIPAVWFYSTSATATKNRLLICSAVNGNGNFCFTSGVNVPRGQWATIEINQRLEGNSYTYIVKVNGAVLGSVINKKAQQFSNVKVFGADNWHNAAQGSMRNLIINPDFKDTCMEMDVDYLGHDLIKKPNFQSWQSCGRWCQSTSNCHAWTWASVSYQGSWARQICFLKTSTWRQGRVKSKRTHGLVSGSKNCPGVSG